MNIRCRHWTKNEEYPGRGDCALGVRVLPEYSYCKDYCIKYQEPDLPIGQRTLEKEPSKIDDFLKAQAELIAQGRVSEEIAEYRLTVCTGISVEGRQVTAPCNHYRQTGKKRGDGKCGACGCKTWKISDMKVKVYYPMGCPVNRFSPMPGRRKDVNNSSTRPQPETEEGQGSGPVDTSPEGGWPPSQTI